MVGRLPEYIYFVHSFSSKARRLKLGRRVQREQGLQPSVADPRPVLRQQGLRVDVVDRARDRLEPRADCPNNHGAMSQPGQRHSDKLSAALTVAGGLDADVLHLRAVQVERAAERQVERLPGHRDEHHVEPALLHVRARPEVLLLATQHCAPHTAITAQPGSRTVGATRAFDVLGPS